MCEIAGPFLKDKSLEPELGAMLSDMLLPLAGTSWIPRKGGF